jgi:hypothetical protein
MSVTAGGARSTCACGARDTAIDDGVSLPLASSLRAADGRRAGDRSESRFPVPFHDQSEHQELELSQAAAAFTVVDLRLRICP